MIAANMNKSRPRERGSRGIKGWWMLVLAGVSLAAAMILMAASADQTPYGATQVWSAEPKGTGYVKTSMITSPAIGGRVYGQDMGSLPAATLIHVGAQ